MKTLDEIAACRSGKIKFEKQRVTDLEARLLRDTAIASFLVHDRYTTNGIEVAHRLLKIIVAGPAQTVPVDRPKYDLAVEVASFEVRRAHGEGICGRRRRVR